MDDQSVRESIDEVWALFKETDALLTRLSRETDERFRETDERFRKTDERFRKTGEKLRETDEMLGKRIGETTANLQRLEGLFGSQWGRLIEALVEPGALRLFRERGVDVHRTHRRSESQVNGDNMEVDLILEDESEVVVVEVKSALKVWHVDELLEDLARFTYFFPKYAGYHLYGAVAALSFDEEADRYAYRKGLFVVGVTGDGLVQILNDPSFSPRDFGKEPPDRKKRSDDDAGPGPL